MRKGLKQFLTAATAAVLAASACSLAACGGSDFVPPDTVPEGEVVSNGGFAVQKGDYIYFINGAEAYTADNTYGTPVRGALMRVKKGDVEAKKNTAETVIPSLMVAGDYGAGIYIYGDRVYYATPNNVNDTEGELQSEYLDFKSAKLDGTDIRDYFRLADNTTTYRIVEAGEGDAKSVYIVYIESGSIYSYNVNSGAKTLLVANATGNTLGGKQVDPEWIYYTMDVTDKDDTEGGAITYDYNQIYRVRVDWTEGNAPGKFDAAAPYTYTFDETFVEEELGGVPPYRNIGELVLDGRGSSASKTQFNHGGDATPATPYGYEYTIQSCGNGGIYFTRTQPATTDSTADTGAELYYLAEADIEKGDWNSVSGNESAALQVVASRVNASKASSSALFYIDEAGQHHYLYVSGTSIYRADVARDGSGRLETPALEIAHDLTSPTLSRLDFSDPAYGYVYYTSTSGSGVAIGRAVVNGDEKFYEDMQFSGQNNKPYRPVEILDIKHDSAWYPFELIDGTLYYADADTTVNSTAYNYICAVSLKKDGAVMNNEELAAYNDRYDEIMGEDDGLLAKLSDDGNTKLSAAIKYYFYTGETAAFDDNVKEAVEEGNKSETYLYTETEKAAFHAFAAGEGYTDGDKELFAAGAYKDGETSYRVRSYFVTQLGTIAEAHVNERNEYWHNALQRYIVPAEPEETGLAAWEWALIGIAIGVFVAGCGVGTWLIIRAKKKKGEKPEKQLMRVDTTDDRNVNVYEPEDPEETVEENTEPEAPAESEEAPAEPAGPEATEEVSAESETPAEPAAPTDEPSDPSAE